MGEADKRILTLDSSVFLGAPKGDEPYRKKCLDLLRNVSLCSEHGIYAIDTLYLSVAISSGAIVVSLDREEFVDKLKKNRYNIEVYHVSEFPY